MSDETNLPRGTSAHMPDLNWSQVRETVLMLELSAVQIEAAMKDSNSSVEVLTDSFTTMAGYMRMISDTVQTLPDQGEVGAAKQNLIGVSEHVSGMVHQAIIAFQFYDKLVQRLAHVGISLGDLSNLVSDSRRLFNAWPRSLTAAASSTLPSGSAFRTRSRPSIRRAKKSPCSTQSCKACQYRKPSKNSWQK